MEAAERGDFDEAAKLRDRISILRGVAPSSASSNFGIWDLVRQQPSADGLGTCQLSVSPPERDPP